MNGWIKISRKITEMNGYFGEKFSRPMCWIDLLMLAEWKSERSFFIRGNRVVVKRGQIAISIEELKKRWSLAKFTVRRRLQEFEEDDRISISRHKVVNIITIINYERYQSSVTDFVTDFDTPSDPQNDPQTDPQNLVVNKGNSESYDDSILQSDTQNDMQSDPQNDPQNDPQTDLPIKNNKNIKNNNIKKLSKESKEKKVAAKAATLARKDEFYNSLIPFVEKYGKETIHKFFDYWSEMNRSETKMRFEQQPTWETSRRLVTWSNNDKKYSNARDKRTDEDKRRGTQITATQAEDYSDTF